MEYLKRTWAEISIPALQSNIRKIQSHLSKKSEIMGVVKADAYGHGVEVVTHTLWNMGVKYFAVSNLIEAIEVRKRLYNEYIDNSIKPSENSKYSNYTNYILLAAICIMFYEHTESLKYLNTLLKLDDTILSLYNVISEDDKNIFGYILRNENVYIKELMQKSCVDVEGVE